MKEEAFENKHFRSFEKSSTVIMGFGSNSCAIGSFSANIEVDQQGYEIKFYIVINNAMKSELILLV